MKNAILFFLGAVMTLVLNSCGDGILSDSDTDDSNTEVGIGGSLNTFSIIGNYLYVLDNIRIETYDISIPEQPLFIGSETLVPGIETIFPFDSFLFVGARDGLYICEREANGMPKLISEYRHIVAKDPVVTDGEYAYVTLSETVNELQILNIEDIYNPVRINSVRLDTPKGLGIDSDLLFVTLAEYGMKIFDISEPRNIVEIESFDNFFARDVIPYDGLLLVMGDTTIHQFDYTDTENIFKISSINIE